MEIALVITRLSIEFYSEWQHCQYLGIQTEAAKTTLHLSSQKIVNETESSLLFLDKSILMKNQHFSKTYLPLCVIISFYTVIQYFHTGI